MQQKRALEKKMQEKAGNSEAWKTIAEVQQERIKLHNARDHYAVTFYAIAEDLVLMAVEDKKPSAERLREFGDAVANRSNKNSSPLPRSTMTSSA